MYYYIYRITNIHTGKFYIGSHKTQVLNDGYFGSGIYLRRSIKKYGKENFIKEYIEFCETEDELRRRETEILNTIKADSTYNLKYCSMGGNTREKYNPEQKKEYIQKLISNPNSPIGKRGEDAFNYGRQAELKTKLKQSTSHKQRWFKLKDDVNFMAKLKEHALTNQKKMAALGCKQVGAKHKETGEIIIFESRVKCAEYFNVPAHIILYFIKNKNTQKYAKIVSCYEFFNC